MATLVVSMAAGLLMGLRRGRLAADRDARPDRGRASGLTAITRELGGDERVVAVVQYLRVGMVIATMPVVAATLFGATVGGGPHPRAAPATAAPWFVDTGFLLVAAGAGVGLARLTRMPAGGLLGPTGSSRWR